MIRELVLAIGLGAILGFGLTGSYFTLKKYQNSSPAPTPSIAVSPIPSNNNPSTIQPTKEPDSAPATLTIDSPSPDSVVNNSKVTIKGSFQPNSNILIFTPIDGYQIKTDSSGNFSSSIEIESGFNTIYISALDPQNNQTDSQLNITYTTATI